MLPDYKIENPPDLQDPLDLRAAPRVATDLAVSLYSRDLVGPLQGRIRDLSTAGACIATASPFAVKSLDRVVISLPNDSLVINADGCWQNDAVADDLIFSGVTFVQPTPEILDRLWEWVFAIGRQLARFLIEQTQLYELGVEEGLALAQNSRYRDISAGRYIYRQGTAEPGEDSIFVLIHGGVALQSRVRDAREVETRRIKPGEMFGGLPLIGAVPHAESAVAAEDSRLLEIDRQAFRYMRQTKPWLGYRVGQALLRTHAVRLAELQARFRDGL